MLVKPEELLNPYYHFMVVGPYKSGKTQSLASLYWWYRNRVRSGIKLPDGSPTEVPTQLWHFDLDRDGSVPLVRIAQYGTANGVTPSIPGGWLSDLRVYKYRVKGDFGKIGETDAPKRTTAIFDQFITDFNSLYDLLDPRTGYWRDPKSAPGIIVIDGATRLEEIITDFIAATRNRELNSADASERARFADWGAIKDKEVEIVESAINLPAHFVYCVHDELREKQVQAAPLITQDGKEIPKTIGTGDIFVMPALTGQLRDTMGAKFTAVLWSRNEGSSYYWMIQPQQEGAAKIRGAGTRTKDGLGGRIPQDFRLIL